MIERASLHVPHVLLASLCVGIACSNATRADFPVLLLLGTLAALAGVAITPARMPLLAVALALSGWWWGSVRLEAIDRSPLAAEVGRAGVARVVVTGPARRSTFALRVPGRVERFGAREIHEPVLLELPVGRSPPQGAILELEGLLVEPRGPKDGFDERTWLRRHGVHAVLRAREWRLVGRRGGLGGLADRLRSSIAEALASGTSGERRAVLLGIVLGDDEGLAAELRARFRASGLYHLLAVSGQNVAIVAGGVLLAAWLIGIPRLAGEIGALAAIGCYVLAVGSQPSVVRAGVAGSLASLAWICARQRDRWWFLLLGAVALLAWSPYNLLDPGFQLSFAAVAAIFLIVPPLMRRLEGYPLPRGAAAAVAVSAACGVATAPILLFQFGSVPAYSVLSNALAAPVVAPLLGLGLLAAAAHPVLPEVAALLSAADGWLAAYLVLCARAIAALPHSQLGVVPVLVATTGCAAVFLVLRRAPPRRRRELMLALAGAAVLGVLAWPALSRVSPPPPVTGLRITFLDVGQGDAVLVQVPQGAMLVDEGPPEAHVDRLLKRLGVGSLSILALTHPQRDHVGGAEAVLEHTQVRLVLDPRLAAPVVPEERAALLAAREHDVPVVVARAGATYRLGRLRIRILWPDGPGLASEDPNNRAIVLLVSYGATDALLAADAESNVLLPLRVPPVEILKVSHHGSEDALLPALLDSVRPRVAVISAGEGNPYGHPRSETLAALAAVPGLAVYRTDHDGDVVVESDGHKLAVRTDD